MATLFSVHGGVHPDYYKDLTCEQAIVALPLPALLTIPLQQHVGAPAQLLVTAGERVKKGQMIARCDGPVSAPQHAPTSGHIQAIADITAPHPSGLPQTMIVIEPDGQDEWADLPAPIDDPFAVDPQVIRDRVARSGIVGMGGAVFPAAVKLDLGSRYRIEALVVNGAECEPYITCDDRLMREYAGEVIDGALIVAHALGASRVIVGIEQNKPQAIAAMTEAAAADARISVVGVPVQYPMGYAHKLILATTGREIPAGKRTAEVGVVAYNVGTVRAVAHAVRLGRPLISRVVTVSGGAVRKPGNLVVPIGVRVADLIDFCGGFETPPVRLVNGGPMMGEPLPSLEVPVVKGTAGILALTAAEVNEGFQGPCIRCGACVTVCPCGLVPMEMAAFIRKDNLEGAARLGVEDCIGCGSCSWVCPAYIPLVQYFRYANGKLNSRARERSKNERTRTLVEARSLRLERTAAKRASQSARQAPITDKASP
ncbi:Ion-translocating oxidoreductase complex subunit C [Gammaproteobacteria bacterium]